MRRYEKVFMVAVYVLRALGNAVFNGMGIAGPTPSAGCMLSLSATQ